MKASRDEEKGVELGRLSPFQRIFPRFLRRRWCRDADAFCHRLKLTFTFNFYKILKVVFNSLDRVCVGQGVDKGEHATSTFNVYLCLLHVLSRAGLN